MQKQIEELQAAASQNSSSIKELAAQLNETISAIERGAVSAENQLKRATLISLFSLGIAALALFAAISILIWK